MTKPIENLSDPDAQAFRAAISPHLLAVLETEGFTLAALSEAVLLAGMFGSPIPSWEALQAALADMPVGARGAVSRDDLGEHVDPVSGQTVPNAGAYEKLAGYLLPVRVDDLDSQISQDWAERAFGGLPYAATIAQGLIDHPANDALFQVLASDRTYSIAYRNDGGSAVEVNRLPSKAAIDAVPTAAAFQDVKAQVDQLTADPLNAVTGFGVSISAFQPIVNTNASRAFNSRQSYLSFPKQVLSGSTMVNADSRVVAVLEFPSHWANTFVDVWLLNLAAASGNVSVSASILPFTDGDTIDSAGSGGTGGAAVVAMPAALLTVKKARLGPFAVSPGKLHAVNLNRNGTSGSDTLANAFGVMHVQAVKAP